MPFRGTAVPLQTTSHLALAFEGQVADWAWVVMPGSHLRRDHGPIEIGTKSRSGRVVWQGYRKGPGPSGDLAGRSQGRSNMLEFLTAAADRREVLCTRMTRGRLKCVLESSTSHPRAQNLTTSSQSPRPKCFRGKFHVFLLPNEVNWIFSSFLCGQPGGDRLVWPLHRRANFLGILRKSCWRLTAGIFWESGLGPWSRHQCGPGIRPLHLRPVPDSRAPMTGSVLTARTRRLDPLWQRGPGDLSYEAVRLKGLNWRHALQCLTSKTKISSE